MTGLFGRRRIDIKSNAVLDAERNQERLLIFIFININVGLVRIFIWNILNTVLCLLVFAFIILNISAFLTCDGGHSGYAYSNPKHERLPSHSCKHRSHK